ncbi:UNVERIFIED_CONTAM: hypothetical protein FKN15_072881 [Acipenser sinensis]
MQQIRISWFKDGKDINSKTQTGENVSSSLRGKTYLEIHNTTYATLNITDTHVSETGVYWCNVIVEIPMPLQNGTGPGTTLKFNDNKYKAHKSHNAFRKQNRMKGMSEDVYQNVGCRVHF